MAEFTAVVAVALFGALAAFVIRRVRDLQGDVTALADRVRELSARLEATEHDAATAVARVDVAENVLLEKGVADEEDLEAARARSGGEAGYVRGRDGALH